MSDEIKDNMLYKVSFTVDLNKVLDSKNIHELVDIIFNKNKDLSCEDKDKLLNIFTDSEIEDEYYYRLSEHSSDLDEGEWVFLKT